MRRVTRCAKFLYVFNLLLTIKAIAYDLHHYYIRPYELSCTVGGGGVTLSGGDHSHQGRSGMFFY